mmetsp:Transcript_90505/g.156908  ORF Transcript_90505/g.156908 Transcript_90505/m.156908 type:complete len:124 (-) Transcript_90505:4125-4496(-)
MTLSSMVSWRMPHNSRLMVLFGVAQAERHCGVMNRRAVMVLLNLDQLTAEWFHVVDVRSCVGVMHVMIRAVSKALMRNATMVLMDSMCMSHLLDKRIQVLVVAPPALPQASDLVLFHTDFLLQ